MHTYAYRYVYSHARLKPFSGAFKCSFVYFEDQKRGHFEHAQILKTSLRDGPESWKPIALNNGSKILI
jgi:hypothetical protein